MKNTPSSIAFSAAGYALSLVLTLAAFGLTYLHIRAAHLFIPHYVLIPAILGLALLQFAAQLFFFLGFGRRGAPRWERPAFALTFGLVLIIIAGSVWIMSHLNYNMTPGQVSRYLEAQQGGF